MDELQLTANQKRSLRASLLSFEKALRGADRLLGEQDGAGDESGILYYRRSRLAAQQRRLIQKKIAETLAELDQFAKKLKLEPSEESLEGIIVAELSVSWENLEACRSNRFRGYGKLHPQAAALLDPYIDHFAQTALELSRLAASDPAEEPPASG